MTDNGSESCKKCLLKQDYCICRSHPVLRSAIDFCLVMDEREPARPSNTGKLIADCLASTQVFVWSRTDPDPALIALLEDDDYQPYLVFPGEYAVPSQQVVTGIESGQRRALLVILDGTWAQARKMLRKSPYLQRLLILNLAQAGASRYRLRRSNRAEHLCTVEVAQACLELAGEAANAIALNAYFERFSQAYLDAREHRPPEINDAPLAPAAPGPAPPLPYGGDPDR